MHLKIIKLHNLKNLMLKMGYLEFKLKFWQYKSKLVITKVQIEEDTAKAIHGKNESYLNFNRASIPLIEIISEPDMRNSEEAYEYLNTLKNIIKIY